MRTALALTTVLVSTVAAQANPGPAPQLKLSPSPSEYAIASSALGAMLESDYFRSPQGTIAGNACRMRFDFLDKTRLAADCR